MLLVLNKAVVHFVGRFDEAHVRTLVTTRERRRDERLERRVEEVWTRRIAEAPEASLWDGEILRLVAHGALPDRVALFVGRTTYREFVGTNLESPDLYEDLGEDYYANPLGVSALLVTRDEEVLLARRSSRVAEAQRLWDLPGGNVPWVAGAVIHPFAAMREELREEIGLEADEVEDLACVGLVENGNTHKPDLIFCGKVRERAKGLLRRARAAKSPEHDDFLCLPVRKADLLDFLRTRGDEATPVAAGALAILIA